MIQGFYRAVAQASMAWALAVVPGSLSAQSGSVDYGDAPVKHVDLSNFSFAPNSIHLKARRPVMLHLVSAPTGGHDFTAPEFFAAATVRPEDAHLIKKGRIEVPAGAEAAVVLIPAPGRYKLSCSHAFHSMRGMSGIIVVS